MAIAALRKSARTSGFHPRSDKGTHRGSQSEEADKLITFLRSELLELRNRLGWSHSDFMRKMPKYKSRQAVESALKVGGFRPLVEFARAMGVRVIVDIR